jgi:hypothetical protein
MTMVWKHSQEDKSRTEGVIDRKNTDWISYHDETLGVSRRAMGDSLKPATIELIEPDHPPDDYLWASGMFVVSDRLKQLMEQFSVHAEFLDVRILIAGAEYTDQKFYCCNILDAVDCFDHNRGECTFHESEGFTDHIDKIAKLAIDETKASSYHLFVIAKGGEYITCASNSLVDAIQASGVTGIMFVEPEAWPVC